MPSISRAVQCARRRANCAVARNCPAQAGVLLPVLTAAALGLSSLGANAQGVVGHGFVLDAPASVTTAPGELISGKGSIKVSYSGPGTHTLFLHTDPAIFPLKSNRPYKIEFKYRILTSGSAGIEVLFWAPNAPAITSRVITGAPGDSGSATQTSTLGPGSGYQAQWKVVSTGAFAIDDIQITEADTGALVAAEDGEGPRIAPGPLNFQR